MCFLVPHFIARGQHRGHGRDNEGGAETQDALEIILLCSPQSTSTLIVLNWSFAVMISACND